ncbi:MAG: MgtC/SapB family protein [Clostridia bacterium]|nr:MgtC/SapB family protein [Clostridia bacterium]
MFLQLLAETPVKETLFMYLLNQFSWQQTGDFFLRMIIACICGAGIGFERARRFKGAGMRTHIIVCCGAALIMIVSKYGFADLTNAMGAPFNGTRGADPARVAAQVVSGISFLGAGVIFKNHGMVKGLTTAAGLWVTAGIGLAMGAGLYTVGAFATVLVAALQILMHKFQIGADAYNAYQLQFTVSDSDAFRESLREQLADWNANSTDTKIEHRDDGTVYYDMTVRTMKDLEIDDILSFFDHVSDVKNLNVATIH